MTQSTTQITAKRFFRQDTKPNSAPDGATWVTESDGSGNDTVSRYQYDATTDTWELNSAVGPSEPNAGTNVPGATWRDTSVGVPKQYDGAGFVSTTIDVSSLEVYTYEGNTVSETFFDAEVGVDVVGSEVDTPTLPANTIQKPETTFTGIVTNNASGSRFTRVYVNGNQVDQKTLSAGETLTWDESDYALPHDVTVQNTDTPANYTIKTRVEVNEAVNNAVILEK